VLWVCFFELCSLTMLRRLAFSYRFGRHRSLYTSTRLWAPIQIKMPSLSPTMSEGTIVQWNKKEGEKVSPGDVLCEVQTDKAVMAMEAEEEGFLAKILKSSDSGNITVGELIGVMAESDEDWKSIEIPPEWLKAGEDQKKSAAKSEESKVEKTASAKEEKPSELEAISSLDDGHYGPSVRLLLHKYGLSPEKVKASGPHGILLKEDILNYVNQKQLQPKHGEQAAISAEDSQISQPASREVSPKSRYEDIPLSSMRKTIAKRLSHSKSTIPHAYTSIKCDLSVVEQVRETLRASHGIKISVNDYVIKACAIALRLVPGVNASYDESSGGPRPNEIVDISVAVATPNGLITPIVRQADKLTLLQINAEVKRLAEKAKANKLQPNEFQGGTFTISNLGMFGIREFTAIINPPQCCILAVGGTERISIRKDPSSSKLGVRECMTVTISSDARCVDQNTVAQFLSTLREIFLSPDSYGLHDGLPTTLMGRADADPLVGDSVGLNLRL
jgi:pyruvate dehydrogenase complex dihydrolipoamide acetyltransferase long form